MIYLYMYISSKDQKSVCMYICIYVQTQLDSHAKVLGNYHVNSVGTVDDGDGKLTKSRYNICS